MTPTWDVIGVLDDDPAAHGRRLHGTSVLGPTDLVADHPDALLLACVASPDDPGRRLRLVTRLGLPDERYASVVHPAAIVPRSAAVAPGCIVHAGTVLTADVQLGPHVAVMPAVVLTHDDVIEAGVTFGAGALIAGLVRIGRGAYVGSGALVREHVMIGPEAVIGMGAVVTRSVPAGETWAGVPARRLSARTG